MMSGGIGSLASARATVTSNVAASGAGSTAATVRAPRTGSAVAPSISPA